MGNASSMPPPIIALPSHFPSYPFQDYDNDDVCPPPHYRDHFPPPRLAPSHGHSYRPNELPIRSRPRPYGFSYPHAHADIGFVEELPDSDIDDHQPARRAPRNPGPRPGGPSAAEMDTFPRAQAAANPLGGDPWLDACACPGTCKCRRGEKRMMYRAVDHNGQRISGTMRVADFDGTEAARKAQRRKKKAKKDERERAVRMENGIGGIREAVEEGNRGVEKAMDELPQKLRDVFGDAGHDMEADPMDGFDPFAGRGRGRGGGFRGMPQHWGARGRGGYPDGDFDQAEEFGGRGPKDMYRPQGRPGMGGMRDDRYPRRPMGRRQGRDPFGDTGFDDDNNYFDDEEMPADRRGGRGDDFGFGDRRPRGGAGRGPGRGHRGPNAMRRMEGRGGPRGGRRTYSDDFDAEDERQGMFNGLRGGRGDDEWSSQSGDFFRGRRDGKGKNMPRYRRDEPWEDDGAKAAKDAKSPAPQSPPAEPKPEKSKTAKPPTEPDPEPEKQAPEQPANPMHTQFPADPFFAAAQQRQQQGAHPYGFQPLNPFPQQQPNPTTYPPHLSGVNIQHMDPAVMARLAMHNHGLGRAQPSQPTNIRPGPTNSYDTHPGMPTQTFGAYDTQDPGLARSQPHVSLARPPYPQGNGFDASPVGRADQYLGSLHTHGMRQTHEYLDRGNAAGDMMEDVPHTYRGNYYNTMGAAEEARGGEGVHTPRGSKKGHVDETRLNVEDRGRDRRDREVGRDIDIGNDERRRDKGKGKGKEQEDDVWSG